MNYIISYPRSGNTWLRYIIEYLSNQSTNGLIDVPNKHDKLQKPLLKSGNNFIAHKLHSFDEKITDNDKVIIIIRNYKECIIRHNKDKRGYDFELFEKQNQGKRDDYIGIIKHFDQFNGKKLYLYYEDLINDSYIPKICYQLCQFLQIENSRINSFLDNLQSIKSQSLCLYPKSKTKGKSEIHHSQLLTWDDRLRWDFYLAFYYRDLYLDYLTRYEEQ